MSTATTAKHCFGLNRSPWTAGLSKAPAGQKGGARGKGSEHAQLVVLGTKLTDKQRQKHLRDWLPAWQEARMLKGQSEMERATNPTGPVIVVAAKAWQASPGDIPPPNPRVRLRDLGGAAVAQLLDLGPATINVELHGCDDEELAGATVGLELGSYRYRLARQQSTLPKLTSTTPLSKGQLGRAGAIGVATNLARHLVNIPAADLNPTSYSKALKSLFASHKDVTFTEWHGPKLKQASLNLLNAVGQAASEGPRLVRVRYRPASSKGGKTKKGAAPLAFVGKGITFDSGGLDIKPAAGMRNMKKDMGGSAAVAGLAHYVVGQNLPVACDFYFCLAENSVSDRAFRPGDCITARNDLQIEIDNTDAEGRLVLADGLQMAAAETGQHAPAAIINVATLTGAMRVALGTKIGGYFANHDLLADQLRDQAAAVGEPVWRLPLMRDYLQFLRSHVGDMVNSASTRFGGAITAALFLERFVDQVPWAHFDVYAWTDRPDGALAEPGGNGQAVQGLAAYVEAYGAKPSQYRS